MKYSAIKAILKELHEEGWEKDWKGSRRYRKVWSRGELRYAQYMSMDEILYANAPLFMVLKSYNERAEWEFDKFERKLLHD